jgi:hypothetical protein
MDHLLFVRIHLVGGQADAKAWSKRFSARKAAAF